MLLMLISFTTTAAKGILDFVGAAKQKI